LCRCPVQRARRRKRNHGAPRLRRASTEDRLPSAVSARSAVRLLLLPRRDRLRRENRAQPTQADVGEDHLDRDEYLAHDAGRLGLPKAKRRLGLLAAFGLYGPASRCGQAAPFRQRTSCARLASRLARKRRLLAQNRFCSVSGLTRSFFVSFDFVLPPDAFRGVGLGAGLSRKWFGGNGAGGRTRTGTGLPPGDSEAYRRCLCKPLATNKLHCIPRAANGFRHQIQFGLSASAFAFFRLF